jgi:hypothetical protein
MTAAGPRTELLSTREGARRARGAGVVSEEQVRVLYRGTGKTAYRALGGACFPGLMALRAFSAFAWARTCNSEWSRDVRFGTQSGPVSDIA